MICKVVTVISGSSCGLAFISRYVRSTYVHGPVRYVPAGSTLRKAAIKAGKTLIYEQIQPETFEGASVSSLSPRAATVSVKSYNPKAFAEEPIVSIHFRALPMNQPADNVSPAESWRAYDAGAASSPSAPSSPLLQRRARKEACWYDGNMVNES